MRKTLSWHTATSTSETIHFHFLFIYFSFAFCCTKFKVIYFPCYHFLFIILMYNLLRVVESAVLEKQTTVQYHGKNAIPLPTSNIIWYLAFKNAKKKAFLKKFLKTLKKMYNDIFERFFEYHILEINGSTSFLWPWEPVWKWDIFHVFAFSFSFIFLIWCTKHPPTPHWEIPGTNRGFSSRFRSI